MRCKNCKNKFEPIRFNQKYCLENECIKVFVQETKDKEWKKRKSKMKKDLMTVQDYIKIAQQVFNQYINLRDSGKPCISCFKPIKGRVNASHYYNANNHWSLRFDEDNVHSSCINCNQYLSGNLIEYRKGLEKKIGIDRIKYLDLKSNETRKYTVEELKEIIKHYKKEIKLFQIKNK